MPPRLKSDAAFDMYFALYRQFSLSSTTFTLQGKPRLLWQPMSIEKSLSSTAGYVYFASVLSISTFRGSLTWIVMVRSTVRSPAK